MYLVQSLLPPITRDPTYILFSPNPLIADDTDARTNPDNNKNRQAPRHQKLNERISGVARITSVYPRGNCALHMRSTGSWPGPCTDITHREPRRSRQLSTSRRRTSV